MAIALDKILCPTDFSEPSEVGIDYAVELAATLGAALRIVHVFQNPAFVLPMSGYVGPTAEVVCNMRRQCEEALDRRKTAIEARGVPVTIELSEGVPHQVIVSAAQSYGASFIVMGTHGRTGLSHAFMGSVAERVMRTADRPVLTVRPPATSSD